VADDHHLVGLAFAHRVGDVAGEGIQPLAPILPLPLTNSSMEAVSSQRCSSR